MIASQSVKLRDFSQIQGEAFYAIEQYFKDILKRDADDGPGPHGRAGHLGPKGWTREAGRRKQLSKAAASPSATAEG